MPRRLVTRIPIPGRAIVASIAILAALVNGADGAPTTKKASRKSQPPAQSKVAPDVTSTIAPGGDPKSSASTVPAKPEAEDESIPPAFNLPTASRARFRACGERWQEMKMSGEAKDQTWRAYATRCLASKDGPDTATRP